MTHRHHLVLATSIFTLAGCAASSDERSASTTSRIESRAEFIGDTYVETWEDAETASQRANDMRAVGLVVEQRGGALYVPALDGGDVSSMVESASSDDYTMRWGGGGGANIMSRPLTVTAGRLTPRDVNFQPEGWPIEVAFGGGVTVSGSIQVRPRLTLNPSSCGRGCIRMEGQAGIEVQADFAMTTEGSAHFARDVYTFGEIPLGSMAILLPTPIPIPVIVHYYVGAAISCEGNIEGRTQARASFGVSGGVDYSAEISGSPQASLSPYLTPNGDFDLQAEAQVEFGCTIPEVKVGARIYGLGGPVIASGPAFFLRADEAGRLHADRKWKTSIGVEAKGLGTVKVDGPEIDMGTRDF